jgi:hypothetical protein
MALKLVPTRPSKQTLAGIPLFQDLPHDVVRDLSQHCKWHCYRAHETIIEFRIMIEGSSLWSKAERGLFTIHRVARR